MNFEQALSALKEGKEVVNHDWNGAKLEDKDMYLRLQKPDEHSMNTEPYIVMLVGTHMSNATGKDKGWAFKRFPWLASNLDLFSEAWALRTTRVQ